MTPVDGVRKTVDTRSVSATNRRRMSVLIEEPPVSVVAQGLSKRQLSAELDQAAVQYRLRPQPLRTVRGVDCQNGARIQHVIDIEIDSQPALAPYVHVLRQAQIEL